MLTEWGLAEISADAETVVTELLSNAIKATSPPGRKAAAPPARTTHATAGPHAPAPADIVILYLAADCEHVTVIVWDPSQHPPERRQHDSESLDGRGLDIVEAISAQWGSIPMAEGKLVWARLTRPCDTGHP
jgi:hypothetical protein